MAYLFPESPDRTFLHRVAGLPGEEIEVRDKQVFVNSSPLDEPYARQEAPLGFDRVDWGPETVPEGHLLVLGDNRDNSRDSRFWGYLPIDNVLGQARMVYYSTDRGRAPPPAGISGPICAGTDWASSWSSRRTAADAATPLHRPQGPTGASTTRARVGCSVAGSHTDRSAA